MILSYKKLPCEKQRPLSNALFRVLCISLSFFWPVLAFADSTAPSPSKPETRSAVFPKPAPAQTLSSAQANTAPSVSAASSPSADLNSTASNTGDIWDLTDKTDREINELVRSWPQLNAAQRRDLLAEVRVRMNKARAQSSVPNAGQGRTGKSDIEVGLNRAQRQFKYGQSIPRSQQGTVVITAKVTRVLPDGTRVTQSTVTPVPLQELRKRAASGSSTNIQLPNSQLPVTAATENPEAALVGSPQAKSDKQAAVKPRRQVFTATVRFGAGFGRRDEDTVQGQRASAPSSSAPQNVQQVSTSIANAEAHGAAQGAAHGAVQKNPENNEQGAQALPDQASKQNRQQAKGAQ